MTRKIDFIFTSNSSWYIWNFRINLIEELLNKKFSVLVVAPFDSYSIRLKNKGCMFINWDLQRSSINPINEFKSLLNIFKIYKRYQPKIIHQFTIKSCLYGSIAAKLLNKSYLINSITGLGHLFLTHNLKNYFLKIITMPFYRFALNYKNSILIFQNESDKNIYNKLNLIKVKSTLIKGSGVDTKYFSPVKNNHCNKKVPIILFPSRIIKEKGIVELIKSCSILVEKGFNFELNIVGNFDKGNRSFLLKSDIDTLITDHKKIKYLGHQNNMRKLYSNADLIVLPSWREGLSRSLLEAASMECAIITTNVPGCNDIIDHGENGLLVPLKDEKALSLAIELLLKNKSFSKKIGKNARKKVLKNFDEKIIIKKTLEIYEKIISQKIA